MGDKNSPNFELPTDIAGNQFGGLSILNNLDFIDMSGATIKSNKLEFFFKTDEKSNKGEKVKLIHKNEK